MRGLSPLVVLWRRMWLEARHWGMSPCAPARYLLPQVLARADLDRRA